MRVSTYKKLYAWAIMLSPIIFQYSIANVVDLDIIAMLLVVAIGLIGKAKISGRTGGVLKSDIAIYLIYVAVVTVANLLVGVKYSAAFDIVMRCGRYCLFLYFVLIRNADYFDYNVAMRIYRRIVYVACAYIVIQSIVYYATGVVLPSKIGGNDTSVYIEGFGRLGSFYSEPASLSYAIIPFLVCSLFGPRYENNNKWIDALVVSVTIILSTSGQGVICLIAVWLIWAANGLVAGRIRFTRFLGILIIIGVFVWLARTPIISFTLGRVNNVGQNGAVSARINGYSSLKLLNPVQLIFGTGYGNYIVKNIYNIDTSFEYIYYSSLAEQLFTTGIIGTLLIVVLFIKRYRQSHTWVRVLIIATLILALGGAPLSAPSIPLYFSLVFSKQGSRENNMVPSKQF